jgi:hypothetical protein
MNCEKCQELLSDYIDGDLSVEEHRLLASHLEECLPCYSVREDLEAIVGFCREHRGEYDPVPNSRAMWVRIRNTVEMERQASSATAASSIEGKDGFWERLGATKWQLSFTQLAATVSAIAIAVSIITTASISRLRETGDRTEAASSDKRDSQTTPAPDIDGRLRRQQFDINYWNQRVEQRKARWSSRVRDAFEKNLSAVDRTVMESRQQLIQNPHDEISEEMLNAALNEKMELLKDFSDQ